MPGASRRFGLADLNVLIGATAFGFGISRWNFEFMRYRSAPGFNLMLARTWIPLATDLLAPLLIFWSLSLILLRFRSGGVTRRAFCREPGMVVGVATWVALILCLVIEFLFINIPVFRRIRHVWVAVPTLVPIAIAATWGMLIVTGRWKNRRDWIDRAGRALGVTWLVLFVLGWLRYI